MVDLTFRALQAFAAVEETGSIIGAAKQLGGSPSGVSQQITTLEKAVGEKLLDRQSRPLTLTPAGHILSNHARRLLEGLAQAKAELAELNVASLPQLSLAIIDDLDATLTPALVAELQGKFRNCFVNCFSGRSDVVTSRLETRQADIAVSSVLPKSISGYHAIELLNEPVILVTAKNAISRDSDVRAQLVELPFIRYSEALPIGRLIDQHLRRMKFTAPRQFAFEATRSVIAMVVQTGGWALTSPLNLLDAERFVDDVEILNSPFPKISRNVFLISRTSELGGLPNELAQTCKRLISNDSIPRFEKLAPHLGGQMTVLSG